MGGQGKSIVAEQNRGHCRQAAERLILFAEKGDGCTENLRTET